MDPPRNHWLPIPPSIIRQPPPRHHRLLVAADNDESMTEMVEGKCSHNYYLRSCKKRKRLMNLSNDMQFEVLLHLPARDIYDRARLVCRKWYHMTGTHSFIYAHLQHSTYGLLFRSVLHESTFITVERGRIEISKLGGFRWPATTSCNGLVLEFYFKSYFRGTYIVNPVTEQIFVLPQYPPRMTYSLSCGIAYAAASMEYKVVANSSPGKNPTTQPCAILTVGVDSSWRFVRTDHLSMTAKRAFELYPFTTEGFMHWQGQGNRVLTLNVETEILTETPVPATGHCRHCMIYLSAGRYLSLLIKRRKFLWEVWEMKPETGEWRKLPQIELKAQELVFFQPFRREVSFQLIPIGWLKYLEMLVFRFADGDMTTVFVYNLLTREINPIQLLAAAACCTTLFHKNSLVWSGGF